MRSSTGRLRALLGEGKPAFGGWLALPTSFGAEIVSRVGLDWIGIDTQHGLIGYEAMVAMLQAVAAADCPALVRVEWNEPAAIMRALDAGADGVIVPMVSTVDQARAAVAACRYPPEGIRSWGPVRVRLLDSAYSVASSREPICAVMCETLEAITNLDHILDEVAGIDIVYVGPMDLAVSLGLKPSYAAEDPDHRAAMESIASTCARHGVVAGVHCGSPEVGEQWRQAGFQILTVVSDIQLLEAGARGASMAARDLARHGGPAFAQPKSS